MCFSCYTSTVPNISVSPSLCSIVCVLHILAKWFFLWHDLHIWQNAGHFFVSVHHHMCCNLRVILFSSFWSFGLTDLILFISTSSISAFTWVVVISLAQQMSIALSNVRSANLISLHLIWSLVMPHNILSCMSDAWHTNQWTMTVSELMWKTCHILYRVSTYFTLFLGWR